MTVTVLALRRYPVKSMGGQGLGSVEIDPRGLAGDRWYAVRDEDDHLASGKNSRRFRRRDGIFDHTAATDANGQVWVSRGGQRWQAGSPELDAHLSIALEATVRVTAESDIPHQDSGQVSLVGTATLDWCARHWGGDADARRLRSNIVLATDEPFIEETWVGNRLHIGSAALDIATRIPRCRMIDITQDGIDPHTPWLKPAGRDRQAFLGIYLDVHTPGVISTGDAVAVG